MELAQSQTSTSFLLGSSVLNVNEVTAPPSEGEFRNLKSIAVSNVLAQEAGLGIGVLNCSVAGESSSHAEAEMEVEKLMDFKTANFDSLPQNHRTYEIEIEGGSDGRKGDMRTKERSESTNYQSGSRQRPIALN